MKFLISVVLVSAAAHLRHGQEPDVNLETLRGQMTNSESFQTYVARTCSTAPKATQQTCFTETADHLFCNLLKRNKPDLAVKANCDGAFSNETVAAAAEGSNASVANSTTDAPAENNTKVMSLAVRRKAVKKAKSFSQMAMQTHRAPEDELAKEMTHDLEMNFNKIAPFGKEDTAKELQDHAAKTQDTLVDAVENAEVAEIKRAVFRALTRLRAATIKEFDTIARLETQAIDAYNDAHHYRAENPLTHLHEDEAPVETDKLKSFH